MTEHVVDTWFVISVGVAFLAGLLSLFVFFWLRTISREANLKGKSGGEMTGIERLEHYERQIIDMKIRLDALEMTERRHVRRDDNEESVPPGLLTGLAQLLVQASGSNEPVVIKEEKGAGKGRDIDVMSGASQDMDGSKKRDSTPRKELVAYSNPIDYVLHLITDNITTSRDIQITMKKSREHTSRLLKKMYEDGYLLRNEKGRPYTYSVTEKGKKRLEQVQDAGR